MGSQTVQIHQTKCYNMPQILLMICHFFTELNPCQSTYVGTFKCPKIDQPGPTRNLQTSKSWESTNDQLGSSPRQALSSPRKGGTQREESPARGRARGHLSGAASAGDGVWTMAATGSCRQLTSVIIWDLNTKHDKHVDFKIIYLI